MNYQEISGDLIKLALEGKFDVIAHGCNCFCTMKSGIAPQMAKNFGCNKFEIESYPSIEKLGCIDFQTMVLGENSIWSLSDYKNNKNEPELTVVNAYTQYGYGTDKQYLDYEALTLCMRKINHIFKGKHIGLPMIGAGLAGGIWDVIRTTIQEELKDCNVTIVKYIK